MTRKSKRSLVFFIDRSLGGRIVAKALREAGAHVETQDSHFPQDTPDVEWLTAVGQHGWIVLSKDETILRNPVEREALHAANVRAFFLTKQAMTGPEMSALFVKVLRGMENRAISQPAPFIYKISRTGHFTRVK